MDDDALLSGWARIVDKIVRGDSLARPSVIVGPTPKLLTEYGLGAGRLTMTVAKVATCRRKHPEVPLEVWHHLPQLLSDPQAIFPSNRRDGSIVVLLIVLDRDNNPIIVPIARDPGSEGNAVLSVYGKEEGLAWAASQVWQARQDGLNVYEKKGFAAALPQPPVAKATSSSHGLIPSDGTAKPRRNILSIRRKSTD